MPNNAGNAYNLTALCPLLPKSGQNASPTALTRDSLNDEATDENSPLAQVPETYFSRLFVLDDVVYQGKPAESEHLSTQYLVYIASFHGPLDAYVAGLWNHATAFVKRTWRYCAAFSEVSDAPSFVRYLKRCQVQTTFFFNGSTDEPLAEQLKSLYLKQEFSRFAFDQQGASPAALQAAFKEFVARVRPFELTPTWRAGASSLDVAVRES